MLDLRFGPYCQDKRSETFSAQTEQAKLISTEFLIIALSFDPTIKKL